MIPAPTKVPSTLFEDRSCQALLTFVKELELVASKYTSKPEVTYADAVDGIATREAAIAVEAAAFGNVLTGQDYPGPAYFRCPDGVAKELSLAFEAELTL